MIDSVGDPIAPQGSIQIASALFTECFTGGFICMLKGIAYLQIQAGKTDSATMQLKFIYLFYLLYDI